ncbi:hypothetical protein RDMS_01750 [Deinococcus sp. RL]|uniref:hypothetical protein n=1 Tax=Deinococcus sp. RL TaxID=1489678 RepID=UPI0004D5FF72|nr:hypothetical protein [Deinococcus sp. RL]KEF35506.1 hypothetical protein RDMS_01750 [Deinococcus sp. RL]
MKHPVTQLMTALMGSANGMMLHRAVIRALRDADCPNPLEAAAIWEHIVYLQSEQGEWVIFPVEEAPDTVFTPERTFKRLTAWLKGAGLLETRRSIRTYKDHSGNFTLYRPRADTLAEMLGCGPFESDDLAPSKRRKVARSSSISENKREASPNPFFDAVAIGCFGSADQVTNAKRVGAVAAQLKKAGWTPQEILSVLSAVKRKDKWWREKGISPDSFLKYCDLWRSQYGSKEEARPPVVTDETTPADDLDWTALE